METLLIIVGLAATLAAVFWYHDKIWGPRKKAAMMNREPFLSLYKAGFTATDSAYAEELTGSEKAVPLAAVGTVQGYAVEVSFGWKDKSYLLVRVFFKPQGHDYESIMAEWKARQQEYQNHFKSWERGFIAPAYLDSRIQYSFFPPKSTEIIKLAEAIVEQVRKLSVQPIDYGTGSALASAIITESRQRVCVKKASVSSRQEGAC